MPGPLQVTVDPSPVFHVTYDGVAVAVAATHPPALQAWAVVESGCHIDGRDPEPLGQVHVARGRRTEGQRGARELQLTGRLGAGDGRIGRRDRGCRLAGGQPHHAGGLARRRAAGAGVDVPGAGLRGTGRRRTAVLARELRRIGHVVRAGRDGDRGRTAAAGRCASTPPAPEPVPVVPDTPLPQLTVLPLSVQVPPPPTTAQASPEGATTDQGQNRQSRAATACLRLQHLGTDVVLNVAIFHDPANQFKIPSAACVASTSTKRRRSWLPRSPWWSRCRRYSP